MQAPVSCTIIFFLCYDKARNMLFLFRSKKTDETLKGTPNPSIVEPVNVYEDDLKMRAAMYGVLFQAFADQVIGKNLDARFTLNATNGLQRFDRKKPGEHDAILLGGEPPPHLSTPHPHLLTPTSSPPPPHRNKSSWIHTHLF